MERVFHVTGQKPAFGKDVNDFAGSLDMGVGGAYLSFANRLTLTIADDISKEKWSKHPDAIKDAYEKAGCISVAVLEDLAG